MLSRPIPVLVALATLLLTPGLLSNGVARDDDGFTLARFEDGATYTYSATYRLLGAETRQWTIPDYLTITISTQDGDVLIATERRVAPWDLERLPAALDETILGASGTIHHDLLIDSATGWPERLLTSHDIDTWSRIGHENARATERWHRTDARLVEPLGFHGTDAWPGTRYVATHHPEAADRATRTYTARGTLDGRDVYQIGDSAPTPTKQAARSPTCDHPYPEWGGALVPGRHDQAVPEIDVIMSRTAWFTPDIPFPLHSVCTVLHPDEHGSMRTHVAYELTLTDHTRGRPIDLPRAQPSRQTPAPPVPGNGVPRESRGLLHFPLHEAYDDASRVDEVGYRHFRNADGAPLVLVAASYRVREPDAETDDTVQALQHELERTVDKARGQDRVILAWTLTLRNDRDQTLVIKVERSVERDGSIVPLGKEAEAFHPKDGIEAIAAPARVADLDQVLLAWQYTTKVSLDTLQTTPAFGLDHRLDDRTLQVHRAHHEQAHTRHTYRLTDGALVDDAYWVEDATDAPAPSPPQGEPIRPSKIRIRPVDEDLGIARETGLWAAAVLLAATAFQATKWLLPKLAAAPLYAKIAKEHVLDHRSRDEIMHYIEANPGANAEEIRRRLGLGRGTTLHHLDTLERNKLIVSVKSRGRRCYFRPGQVDASRKNAVAALRTPAAEAFYATISANPGTTQKEVAAALGVSHPAVWYQAKRLEEAGAIRLVREGALVRYFPIAPTPATA